jgi:RHS repeat-associated protein
VQYGHALWFRWRLYRSDRARLSNRYYDAPTAQFISLDPEVAETRQPYGFADQDPANEDDPSGMGSLCGVSANGPDIVPCLTPDDAIGANGVAYSVAANPWVVDTYEGGFDGTFYMDPDIGSAAVDIADDDIVLEHLPTDLKDVVSSDEANANFAPATYDSQSGFEKGERLANGLAGPYKQYVETYVQSHGLRYLSGIPRSLSTVSINNGTGRFELNSVDR